MISDEARARIRRLFFAEHWKAGTIAAELGVHRDTVLHAIEARGFLSQAARARADMLDNYRDFLEETLERYPRLRATRLFQMIKERGYQGSVYPIRRYLKRRRPAKREAFLRLTALIGEEAQVDWGSFGIIHIGRATRRLSCFVMVLSWSRATFARFTVDQTSESFLGAHVAAFEAFGGVPRRILYDNLKSAVLERDGDIIRFHPRILQLAGHYHFAPTPVAVARGNEKGRVERRIRDLRDSFFAGRSFRDLDDLNGQLEVWLRDVQSARLVPGDLDKRLVRDAFVEEKTRLLRLPAHPLATELVRPARSAKTPYIRFDRNDYSIPHTHVGVPLTLAASATRVRLLADNVVIASHPRSYDAGQQLEHAEHLEALVREKRHAREARGKNRLVAACPSAEAFLRGVALHGGHLGGTTTRLLHLLDEHPAARLDGAIRSALEREAFHAHSVAHVLDQRRRAEDVRPSPATVLPRDPRVRAVVVTPHALGAYDKLGAADDTDGAS
jgi:transposase